MNTTLLICLFFCHFLADYTWLSTSWMLNAKRFGSPLFPIFCHAFIHASLMGVVLFFFVTNFSSSFLWSKLFLFQLSTHFIIDVLKGRMNVWFPMLQNPANREHWIIFGLDQTFHAIVIILMASFIK